jgi:hypothetical protein
MLSHNDEVLLLNRHISEDHKGLVKIKNNPFCSGKDTESKAMSFREMLDLSGTYTSGANGVSPSRNNKIDFLKFDIEGSEIELLNNDQAYELFIESVSKFAGELHRVGGNKRNHDPNSIKILTKIKDDKRVDLRIHAIDGTNITERFWGGVNENRHNYYNEIIISGKIS